jgi:hypothetical protein
VIDIREASSVQVFRVYHVGFDDLIALSVNGNWIFSDYNGGFYNPTYDTWGRWNRRQVCNYETYYSDEGTSCVKCTKWNSWEGYCEERQYNAWEYENYWVNRWERSTNWSYGVNVDLRPYLKEGRNEIRIDTGVVGGGEGWIFFEISAWKAKCDYQIINACSQYEAAQ